MLMKVDRTSISTNLSGQIHLSKYIVQGFGNKVLIKLIFKGAQRSNEELLSLLFVGHTMSYHFAGDDCSNHYLLFSFISAS